MAKILIVDDEVEFAQTVTGWLRMDQHTVESIHSPIDALANLRAYDYDVVILDWNMPEMTGIELCKSYRSGGGSAAILMLTGLSAVDSRVQGLEAGADDYLPKPCDMKELLARVRALLRRSHAYHGPKLKSGALQLDADSRLVTKNNVEVRLQPQEFAVLEFFMRNAGKVISQDVLINKLWSSPGEVSNDAVYTCIKGIRQKLGDPEVIKTVHGIGYRYDAPQ